MAENDRPFRESLGPRRGYVILADYVQHGRAHVAGESSKAAERRHRHRQEQMFEQIHEPVNSRKTLASQGMEAGYREPAKLDAKQVHAEKRQPEGRHGKSDKDED